MAQAQQAEHKTTSQMRLTMWAGDSVVMTNTTSFRSLRLGQYWGHRQNWIV